MAEIHVVSHNKYRQVFVEYERCDLRLPCSQYQAMGLIEAHSSAFLFDSFKLSIFWYRTTQNTGDHIGKRWRRAQRWNGERKTKIDWYYLYY